MPAFAGSPIGENEVLALHLLALQSPFDLGQQRLLYYTGVCVAFVRVPEGHPRIAQ